MKTQAQISTQELAGCTQSFLSEAEERTAKDDTNLSTLLDVSMLLICSTTTREKSDSWAQPISPGSVTCNYGSL